MSYLCVILPLKNILLNVKNILLNGFKSLFWSSDVNALQLFEATPQAIGRQIDALLLECVFSLLIFSKHQY